MNPDQVDDANSTGVAVDENRDSKKREHSGRDPSATGNPRPDPVMRVVFPLASSSVEQAGIEDRLSNLQEVFGITERQNKLRTSWLALLSELKDALEKRDYAALPRFAMMNHYRPYMEDDLILMASEAILARIKEIVLSEVPRATFTPIFANSLSELSIIFSQGPSEDKIQKWLDDLSRQTI